jgi:hypothetical protein
MQKTVFVMLFIIFFTFSASAQLQADSVQNKLKVSFAAKGNPELKTFFIPPVLPSNFYASHLPFFCDKELKIQKAIKLPIKFRLGSVQYCDKLEGKP